MILNRDQIINILHQHQEDIRRYGVKRLGLFGSFARNVGNPKSDLDFLVEFDTKSFDAYMGLKFFLEELFDHRVDLVLANTLKSRLRENILTETIYAPGF